MPRWKILVSAPYFQPVVAEFQHRFDEFDCELVIPKVHERLSESELLGLIGDIDGAICGDDQFSEAVLDVAPRLKVISKWGTGIDSINQGAARARGIAVRNTPNAFTQPVADTAMGYMLCFARNLIAMDRRMKQGIWDKPPGRALNECCLGIVGVGNIGRAMAERARAFGMRILGVDTQDIDPAITASLGIDMTDTATLLHQSDFVSLHCDLNATSHHIISSDALGKMKKSAVLINTARGPLVEEAALVWALENQEIAGVALDVFEDEPLAAGSILRRFDNAIIAAHNSNSSPKAWQRVHESTLSNLFEVLRGGGEA